MTSLRASACCSAAFLALCGPLAAQHLQGVVLYTHNDLPVASAVVRLIDEGGRIVSTAVSDADGYFAFDVTGSGSYWVQAEHLTALSVVDGPVALDPSSSPFVAFHLRPNPIALEGMEVNVEGRMRPLERAGFYDRSIHTSGFFLAPEDVERRRPIRVSQLLTAVPGIRYVEGGGKAGFSGYPVTAWSERTRLNAAPCYPAVYIDGMMVEPGGTYWTPQQGFDQLLPAHDLLAMEIYRSPAEVPMQYGGLTACGVILMWTKANATR